MRRIPRLARSCVPRAPARMAATCTHSATHQQLSIDILGPRRIVLEGWDRPNAVSVCAAAVDHGLPVLSDKAGAQLIPATHRPPVRDTGVVCGVKWAQTSRNKFLVDPLRDR